MVDKLVGSEVNAKRIVNVDNCFGGSGIPLYREGRVLVGEGVLTKMCRKKPKPRQFFLFNDVLVYGSVVINKKKYNKQHVIPLEDVRVESVEDNGKNRHHVFYLRQWVREDGSRAEGTSQGRGWMLVALLELKNGWLIVSPRKSFAVYAATPSEKHEWMVHINRCVEDLLRKTGKQAPSTFAPRWIPDDEAPVCMSCHKQKFNIAVRRHHCRKCGKVVCSDCSKRKFLLPYQSDKPVRVCDGCFEQLNGTPVGIKPPSTMSNNYTGGNSDDESSDDSDEEVEVDTRGQVASKSSYVSHVDNQVDHQIEVEPRLDRRWLTMASPSQDSSNEEEE